MKNGGAAAELRRMPSSRTVLRRVLAGVAGLALVAAVLPASSTPSAAASVRPAAVADPSCGRSDARLVPRCGIWWGMWPRADAEGRITNRLPDNLASTEAAIGRRVDLVSRYKGWGEDVYDGWDAGFRDSGHLVLEDLTARNFKTNTYVRWADIAAGRYDPYLTRQALRAKRFGARTFFSFNQEPEQALERRTAGTPAEFAAAYRHVRSVFDRAGATNVVWVWWVMGWSGHNDVYDDLWPGADVVDWIGYDPYDFSGCRGGRVKTVAQTLTPWYRWVTAQPWSAGKPLMLPEFGTTGTDKGAWYAAVPSVLRTLPRIKAAVQFNSSPGRCDHRVTGSAHNLTGYRAASSDPYVNPRATLAPVTLRRAGVNGAHVPS